MRVRHFIHFFLLLSTAIAFVACSNLKYIPDNDALYTGAKVSVKGPPELGSKKRKALREELESLTRPRPNKKILGMRIALTAYNIAGNPKKETSPRGWLKYKVGEPPVLLSDLDLENNVKVLRSNLENRGYFRAVVTSDTVVKKKQASATYNVETGPVYTIKNVSFQLDSGVLGRNIAQTIKPTFLVAGKPFDLDIIKAERDRIDAYLKEHGFYFFNPDFLIIQADTTVGGNQVNLFVKVKSTTPGEARQAFRIEDIYVFTNYNLRAAAADTLPRDAVFYKGYYLIDRRKQYKPRLFEQTILFNPNDLYNRTNHNLTLNRLITLGLFKFVKNRFELAPRVDSANLMTYYYLTPLPKKSIRAELNANTKSNNLTGSQLSVGWRNRNALKGGELFTINALGGFEIQYSGQFQGYNTYRGGIETSLSFPRFVIPFITLNTRGGFVPKTTILLGYDLLTKQKLYTLNSFRATFGYNWKENIRKEHEFNPISINYVQPINVSAIYTDSAKKNPILLKAIEKQFILGSTYSYTYNPLSGNRIQTGLYFNGTLDLSGNIAGLITGADVKAGKESKIFHAPFSQYIKAETDARYYVQASSKSVWVTRLILGVGYPYGNSTSLPFIKQFFIGGNNSIRAFRSRSLGPGTYNFPRNDSTTFLPDQSGDIKLEINTEYRAHLFSVVNGAVFVDAGNIWLYNNDTARAGAKFSKNFMKELAVGAGVGLRIDVSFLVLRLDLAFPLRKPYLPEGQRWVINQINFSDRNWRRENLVFNLAIGYPF
jgi:outer membrane protein insertion porin family